MFFFLGYGMIMQWQWFVLKTLFVWFFKGFILKKSHLFQKSEGESGPTLFISMCCECKCVQILSFFLIFAPDPWNACCYHVLQCLKIKPHPSWRWEKKCRTVFCCAAQLHSDMCVFICMIIFFLFISNHSMRAHCCSLMFQKDQHPTLRSLSESL